MEDLSNNRALNGCPKTEARLGLTAAGWTCEGAREFESRDRAFVNVLLNGSKTWIVKIAILQDKLTPDAPS